MDQGFFVSGDGDLDGDPPIGLIFDAAVALNSAQKILHLPTPLVQHMVPDNLLIGLCDLIAQKGQVREAGAPLAQVLDR